MKSYVLSSFAAILAGLMFSSDFAFAEPEIGSEDWHFEVTKTIALELAETPAWSLAATYLRELSPKTQDWNLLLLQAKVELQHGNIDQAQKIIERALSMNNKNPRILAMAGNIASDAGKQDEAIVFFEQVLKLQPKNTQILQALGRIRSARREWDKTIEVYEKLLTQITPTSEICTRLASAYENKGVLDKAEYYLKTNLSVHPNRVLALMPLERFYRNNQMPSKADEIARERAKLQKQEGDQRVLRELQKSSK